ncbi:hypothetical protein EXIGLDRAFT_843826 [Exidia glandulosa HHB12029]|uniref:F-box domain-containing protein n=1 Tax=Exidia glandulosa HHB12029 TaxID=1314781 RepID=A0A165CEN1_EXIGL|nr:hypothetical protein EXIGLDRAFT_843826 [Exidia glandulosa HHB12029]
MPPKRKAAGAKKLKATLSASEDVVPGKAGALVVELLEWVFRLASNRYFAEVVEMLNADENTLGSKRKWGNPLVACSAVNKYWHAVTAKFLYRVVVITRPESMHLLLRSLKANKALAKHIDSFSLDYRYKGIPTKPDLAAAEKARRIETSAATWEVLNMLKGLYHLDVSTYSLEPAPKGKNKQPILPNNVLKGLKSITIRDTAPNHGARTAYSRWVKIAAPTLERLRCRMYCSEDNFLSTCAPMKNLKSLSVKFSSDHSTKFYDLALGSSGEDHAVVEDLSIGKRNYTEPGLRALFSRLRDHAPLLRRLHLGINFDPDIDAGIVYTAVTGILRLTTRLEYFSLALRQAPLRTEQQQREVVDALPSTLSTLRFGQSWVSDWDGDVSRTEFSNEAQMVLDRVEKGELPKLRAIRIGADERWPEAGRDPKRHSTERKANERLAKAVTKAATKLGVDLVFMTEQLPDHLPWFYVNSK